MTVASLHNEKVTAAAAVETVLTCRRGHLRGSAALLARESTSRFALHSKADTGLRSDLSATPIELFGPCAGIHLSCCRASSMLAPISCMMPNTSIQILACGDLAIVVAAFPFLTESTTFKQSVVSGKKGGNLSITRKA